MAQLKGTLIAAAISMLAPSAGAQAQPLELEAVGAGYLTLPVTIGENGPYRFVFDTGASHTAIAQPIAEQLGFVSYWSEYDDIQSLTRRFEAERFELVDFQVSDLDPQNINAVVVPVAPDSPLILAGLIGSDAIGADGYSIDFGNRLLDLDAREAVHLDGRFDPERRLLFGAARVSGQRETVRVLVDSGAPFTIVNEYFRAQRPASLALSLRYGLSGVDGNREEGVSAMPLRNVQFGGVCWDTAAAFNADLDIFNALGWDDVPAMVMGMDMLSSGVLTLDRSSDSFDFTPSNTDAACDSGTRVRFSDIENERPS